MTYIIHFLLVSIFAIVLTKWVAWKYLKPEIVKVYKEQKDK